MDEGQEHHPHLRLAREEPVTDRRSRANPSQVPAPDNPRRHGAMLGERLEAARDAAAADLGGYDERRLIKLQLIQQVSPEDIARASSGIEVVSQEEGKLVLAFASDTQLDEFQAKLTRLAEGGSVTYQNVLYALGDLDRWTPEDRTGWALAREGFPVGDSIVLDAELWPLARGMQDARNTFETWIEDRDVAILDAVRKPYLNLYRIRCDRSVAEDLLRYRDVRTVDLPPRAGLERALMFTPVQRLEQVPSPPDQAPGIAVLDSGVAAAHPVLAPAVGDAQSFLPNAPATDEHGHGTFVAGIALYDDIAGCLREKTFIPRLRLFSGRILDNLNRGDPRLIENQVEEAVRYFTEEYGCRVFNLSYGDFNKPYQGRHVSGLAVTLDALSRELGVLFAVPTGNYEGGRNGPKDWRAEYPDYLTNADASLLDPAPALNALTVGGLARHERNERWPNDPAFRPVARADQPSPFTRHGPSVNGAIKPDLVDYGGNLMVDARIGGAVRSGQQGVGELSINRDFAAGHPFAEHSGTSFAAPRVANAAARILAEIPRASVDLCRALLVSHARTPDACADLLRDSVAIRNLTGYGLVDRSALYRSLENCVTLWAEESIENRRHHFYEVPVPDEFWWGGRRDREITVSLAYRPPVRTTRIDYRAAGITYKFVQAASLTDVARRFNAAIDKDTTEDIAERAGGRRFTEQVRSRGTVQASTWTFNRPSQAMLESSWFVVVTRNDPAWGANLASEREPYALSVTLTDRLAQQPVLYTRIRARLRERIRVQATTR